MRTPILLLTMAQAGDVATTWHGITAGIVSEANPVGRFGITAGLPGLVILKAAAMLATLLGVAIAKRIGHERAATHALRFNAAAMLLVVAWNATRIYS